MTNTCGCNDTSGLAPFRFQSTPSEPPTGFQIETSQKNIEDYLGRLREAIIADIDCLCTEARSKVYGEIYAEGSAVATVIPGSLTWVQITNFTNNGESSGTTPDFSQAHILIEESGVYLVVASASCFSGAGSSAQFEAEVRANNGTTSYPNIHWDRILSGGGGDVGSTSMSGLASLTAGDTVEVWVQNQTNGTDVTFEDINLTVVKVS